MRLLLEYRRGFVVVRMDMRNGYNALSRSVMLRRLAETPRLAHWVPFIHALSKHATPLVVGMMMQQLFTGAARGDSADGTQQGFAPSSTAFSVAIHPELKALDAILKPFGGCARAIMDDVYAAGPASVVFAAVQRFADSLRIARYPGYRIGTRRVERDRTSDSFRVVGFEPSAPVQLAAPAPRAHGHARVWQASDWPRVHAVPISCAPHPSPLLCACCAWVVLWYWCTCVGGFQARLL